MPHISNIFFFPFLKSKMQHERYEVTEPNHFQTGILSMETLMALICLESDRFCAALDIVWGASLAKNKVWFS